MAQSYILRLISVFVRTLADSVWSNSEPLHLLLLILRQGWGEWEGGGGVGGAGDMVGTDQLHTHVFTDLPQQYKVEHSSHKVNSHNVLNVIEEYNILSEGTIDHALYLQRYVLLHISMSWLKCYVP